MTEKKHHPSFVRLFEAIESQGITSPSDLATALRESTQVIGNWAARGVSKAGALKAEDLLGVNSFWILKGHASTITPKFASCASDGSYFKERLTKALEIRGASAADLAREIDKTESAVSQWLSGKVSGMRGDNLLAASAFLRVDPNWLSSGEGKSGLEDGIRLKDYADAVQSQGLAPRTVNGANLGVLLEALHPSFQLAAYAAASQVLIGFLGRTPDPANF